MNQGGVFGADEAGKGPVLGSMFGAAVAVTDLDVLPPGIDDSKQLTPERREQLATAIRSDDRIAVGVGEVTVEEIDHHQTDMNTLTVEVQARAIAEVAGPGLKGIVDAGDTDADRFARRVASAVSVDIDVQGEHRADETHAIVGAASVIAKVARDAHVADLAARHGEIGSGYPSDATTRSFLTEYVTEHGELPTCARASWKTSTDILAAGSQSSLGDFPGKQ